MPRLVALWLDTSSFFHCGWLSFLAWLRASSILVLCSYCVRQRQIELKQLYIAMSTIVSVNSTNILYQQIRIHIVFDLQKKENKRYFRHKNEYEYTVTERQAPEHLVWYSYLNGDASRLVACQCGVVCRRGRLCWQRPVREGMSVGGGMYKRRLSTTSDSSTTGRSTGSDAGCDDVSTDVISDVSLQQQQHHLHCRCLDTSSSSG